MRAVRDAAPARLQPSPQPRIGRAGEPQVAPGSALAMRSCSSGVRPSFSTMRSKAATLRLRE